MHVWASPGGLSSQRGGNGDLGMQGARGRQHSMTLPVSPSHHCKMPLGDGGRCDGGGVVMVHGSGSQSWDCQDGGCQDEVCV